MTEELRLRLDTLHSEGGLVISEFQRSLPTLHASRAAVPVIATLESHLKSVSDSANELSSRVLMWDRVIQNISRTRKLVQWLNDFRDNLKSLEQALKKTDFETAASLVAEFREMDKSGATVLADESVVQSFRSMERAVVDSVRSSFEAAVASGKSGDVARFAKLFQPLGLGSEAMGRYVTFFRKLLADKCNPLVKAAVHPFTSGAPVLADSATKIFLAVADIIQDHQKHIEEEFGAKNFLLFLQGISSEAAVQALEIFQILGKQLNTSSDVRILDTSLEETATLFQRCHQFNNYIHQIARETVSILPSENGGWTVEQVVSPVAPLIKALQETSGRYVQLEQQLMIRSIEQAVKTDSIDITDPSEKVSTLVDDVFFVANKIIARGSATCDIGSACAVANNVVSALQTEFKGSLEAAVSISRKNFASFAATPGLVYAAIKSETPLEGLVIEAGGKVKVKPSSSDSYPHALSNIAQSIDNLANLKADSITAFQEFFVEAEKRTMFSHSVNMLDAVKTEFEELHHSGCRLALHFFKAAFLTPSLVNLDKISFELNEETFADAQVNDVFAKAFVSAATVTFDFCLMVLMPVSFEQVIGLLADQLSARLEKLVLQNNLRFTQLGAVQLDQDVRYISSFFTRVSQSPVRQKFARLVDICTILNFETFDEFIAFYAPKGRAVQRMRLAPDEIKQVLLLRLDFPKSRVEATFS